jgi:hypothetical protein
VSKDENIKTDERGFITYDDIIDSYCARVRVKESSSAEGPHVWIFIEGGIIEVGSSEINDGSAHLNIEQAKHVRDALSKWIDEIPSRWDIKDEDKK